MHNADKILIFVIYVASSFVDGVNRYFANVVLAQVMVILLAQCILAFHLAAATHLKSELKIALAEGIVFLTIILALMAYLASELTHEVLSTTIYNLYCRV